MEDDIETAMFQSERWPKDLGLKLVQVFTEGKKHPKEDTIYDYIFSLISKPYLLPSFHIYIDLSSFCHLAFNNDLSVKGWGHQLYAVRQAR